MDAEGHDIIRPFFKQAYKTCDKPEPQMQHAKFHGNSLTDSRVEDFSKGLYHIWA